MTPAKIDQAQGYEETIEALRRAEQKYRSIFENATEGIFQTTPEGMYLSANPALARMYGYDSPGELLADLLSEWGPRLSRILTSGIIKWGTRDGGEITRWDARLRLIEDSPVMAGFDKIHLPDSD